MQTNNIAACIFVRFCLQEPLFFLDGTMSMSEGKYSAWKYLWTFRWQQIWLVTICANHESSSALSNSHESCSSSTSLSTSTAQQRMARMVSCGSRQRCHRTLRMWCVWTAWRQVQQSVSNSKMVSKRNVNNKHIYFIRASLEAAKSHLVYGYRYVDPTGHLGVSLLPLSQVWICFLSFVWVSR